jgi:RimJ/RimL family protein N-acetyltransferase
MTNHLGQPIGFPVPGWAPPSAPTRTVIKGRFCRLEPLDADVHAASLYRANAVDGEGKNWTYLPYGPFDSFEGYYAWIVQHSTGGDPIFFAVINDVHGSAVGVASYMRINPAAGSIEVGGINYSPLLQRRPAGTEAMFLMMEHAFNLGYRRYEWKCNALNAASRAAAQRLGFSFEGVFRQASVVKGHNRDTAWYSVVDSEWPALKAAFSRWLDPSNFDVQGNQRTKLSILTAPTIKQRG